MDNKTKIQELENAIRKIRSDLMFKGMALGIEKQNVNYENIDKINALANDISCLRKNLAELNTEIYKLKFAYRVVYEVKFTNIWPERTEKQIFDEIVLLDKDLDIDMPDGEWKPINSEVNSLLLELLLYLKYKYDEVTLLRVKRIK
jgi:hypothetical protein